MAIDKAVDSVVLDAGLNFIANAIRAKSGISEKLQFPDGYVSAVNVIQSGTEMEDALVERTLTTYSNSRVTSIGAYAFYRSKFTEANFSVADTIGTSAFDDSNNLVKINLPEAKKILSSVFANCTSLESIDLPKVESFSNSVFRYNKAFKTLIIRAPDKVCSLGNTDCFKFTQIESGTGYIYVPDNLVDQYKAATNWTFYANQIKPLSELPEVSA